MEEKSRIRKEILKLRRAMDYGRVMSLSTEICKRICETPQYAKAHNVCLYSSINNEVCLDYIKNHAMTCGKLIYFPKILCKLDLSARNSCDVDDVNGMGSPVAVHTDDFSDSVSATINVHAASGAGDVKYMEFFLYDEAAGLAPGAFNIPEPVSDTVLIPDEDTLIIMPGAVFSTGCDRIGYGGGYYDRYLSLHPGCKTIAACFDLQIVDALPCEAHDLKPDMIISESNILHHTSTSK